MRALSVRQPWAWLLIRPDIIGAEARSQAYVEHLIKDTENRDWPTSVRGRVLIHASKGMTRDEYDDCRDFAIHVVSEKIELPRFEDLQRGGFIGAVNITDCVTYSKSPWFVGNYGFTSKDAEPLPFFPFRGQLGIFYLPPRRDCLHCSGGVCHLSSTECTGDPYCTEYVNDGL